MYARVAVEKSTMGFDRLFDYNIPECYLSTILPGCRVTVPFGGRGKVSLGFVYEIINGEPESLLKDIDSVLDMVPVLSEELISMAEFIRERTFCTYYDSAKCMLPSGVNHHISCYYTVNDEYDFDLLSENEQLIINYISSYSKPVEEKNIIEAFKQVESISILKSLVKKNAVIKSSFAENNINDKYETIVSISDILQEKKIRTVNQKSVLNYLSDNGPTEITLIENATGVSKAVINNLVKSGILTINKVKVNYQLKDYIIDNNCVQLNEEQSIAYNSIVKSVNDNKYNVSLLFGVTGSGKTSVYLKAIADTVNKGKNVLLLVPEIGLTPQTLEIFTKKFGNKVAIFHSALSVRDRANEWNKVFNGQISIVIGTRSAIFAPISNIGLIIIDEEQEHTYKSEQSPRYDAIELAKFRAHYNNCSLLLASATPSIESYALADSGKYNLLKLKNRYGNAILPDVEIVDMRFAEKAPGSKELSSRLIEGIKDTINNNHQAIILINRRGYNTFVSCNQCGQVITCPHCSISMTYHSISNKLICHYCGYSCNYSTKCHECGEDALRYSGFGTQRIEDEINRHIPDAKILRIDADTTSGKDSHEKLFKEFSEHNFDIMVGTQMVAKGLNFPNVTFVGVISVDQQLYNDDFRSMEKTFDLLTQVVGRSGRGNVKGKAIIQTVTPENEIIQLASDQDYESFYNTEIRIRKMMTYPPYCDLCVLGFIGNEESSTSICASFVLNKIKQDIENNIFNEKIIILGPMPARVVKVKSQYRYRIIIKCHNSLNFRNLIRDILLIPTKNKEFKNITIYADMNPDSII